MPSAAQVLIGPRWEVTKSCGLDDFLWQDGTITYARSPDGAFVRAPPLHAHFTKLTKQCEAFLAGATSMLASGAADDEAAETAVKASALCGDIIAARADVERAMAVVGRDPAAILRDTDADEDDGTASTGETGGKDGGKSKGKGQDPAAALERAYERECERLAFRYAALSRPAPGGSGGLEYPRYNYARELAQTAGATRAPRDRLHLAKELAVTATSLPPGVWVRVDEVRNDMMCVSPTVSPRSLSDTAR